MLMKLATAFLFAMFVLAPCLVAYRVDLDVPDPPEEQRRRLLVLVWLTGLRDSCDCVGAGYADGDRA